MKEKMENYYFKHSSHFNDMFVLFEEFYRSETLSDVIISCEGKNLYAHRMVLCAGSDHFRRLLTSIKITNHLPIMIINDISYEDMKIILEFIYRGQIVVSQKKVETLRQAAYKLKIKGFESFLRSSMNGIGLLNASQTQKTISFNKDKHFKTDAEAKRNKLAQNFVPDFFSRRNLRGFQTESQLKMALQRNKFSAEFAMKRMKRKHDNSYNNENMNENIKDLSDNSVMIKSMNDKNNSQSNMNGHYIKDDCDENEDNQKNEKTENAINESNGFNSKHDSDDNIPNKIQKPMSLLDNQNGGHNQTNGNEEYDSDDSDEFKYTYEMDPNTLSTTWDNDENNIQDEDMNDENDVEEDNFESLGHQPSLSRIINRGLAKFKNGNGKFNGMNGVLLGGDVMQCEFCHKDFHDLDHLNVHIKRCHEMNKMNQCDLCGKSYAWKSGLYKHKRHVHQIGGPKSGGTPGIENRSEDQNYSTSSPSPTNDVLRAVNVDNNSSP